MSNRAKKLSKKFTALAVISAFSFQQIAWGYPILSPSPLRLGSGQAHPSLTHVDGTEQWMDGGVVVKAKSASGTVIEYDASGEWVRTLMADRSGITSGSQGVTVRDGSGQESQLTVTTDASGRPSLQVAKEGLILNYSVAGKLETIQDFLQHIQVNLLPDGVTEFELPTGAKVEGLVSDGTGKIVKGHVINPDGSEQWMDGGVVVKARSWSGIVIEYDSSGKVTVITIQSRRYERKGVSSSGQGGRVCRIGSSSQGGG